MSNNPKMLIGTKDIVQEVQFVSEVLTYNDLATSSKSQSNSANAKR